MLVTGGSQGARLLSEMVPRAVVLLGEDLRMRLKVEQQTRMESMDFARDTYAQAGVEAEIAPFFRNMAGKLQTAHLVIGRAGASTVCELATAGLPSILIPLAIAADDHQRYNAKLLSDPGAAEVLSEQQVTVEMLSDTIARMIHDPANLAQKAAAARSVAKPDAAERLADLVEKVASANAKAA
jgi:UDP-N-acetylglucosamine--N-acetylmuramyl-(pentapeptide) pyrophosphoryl-undecaprenol N-acetylglucosamine transferase